MHVTEKNPTIYDLFPIHLQTFGQNEICNKSIDLENEGNIS